MKAVTHDYRVIKLITVDYGLGPSAGKEVTAHMAVLPNGSHWASRPSILEIRITDDTKPGDMFRLSLEKLACS